VTGRPEEVRKSQTFAGRSAPDGRGPVACPHCGNETAARESGSAEPGKGARELSLSRPDNGTIDRHTHSRPSGAGPATRKPPLR
jgi:hypothetical protein